MICVAACRLRRNVVLRNRGASACARGGRRLDSAAQGDTPTWLEACGVFMGQSERVYCPAEETIVGVRSTPLLTRILTSTRRFAARPLESLLSAMG